MATKIITVEINFRYRIVAAARRFVPFRNLRVKLKNSETSDSASHAADSGQHAKAAETTLQRLLGPGDQTQFVRLHQIGMGRDHADTEAVGAAFGSGD